MSYAYVKFLPENRLVRVEREETLLEAAYKASINIPSPCKARSLCGRCLVKIISGYDKLSEITLGEKLIIPENMLLEGYRLSCKTRVVKEGEVEVLIFDSSKVSGDVFVVEGKTLAIQRLDPEVKRLPINLPGEYDKSIVESIKAMNNLQDYKFTDYSILIKLSKVFNKVEEPLREATLVLYGDTVIDICSRDEDVLGFAVDVGTSKIAGYLVNFSNGMVIETVCQINPQIIFGEDVISRLTYALRYGVDKLQKTVVDGINSLLEEACEKAGCNPENIYEVVAVGNTVMHHLLLGLNPKSLAYSPYIPIIREPLYVNARLLGLNINNGAVVYLPPVIAGYVGSDVVADIIATNLHEEDKVTLLIDMGTNTEILIKKDCKFLVCSAASGPAFEGMHITHGMRASVGAIYKVTIFEDGDVEYRVIGKSKPRGLTGSAVVDIIAGLLRVGLIDEKGRLQNHKKCKRIRVNNGVPEYVIAFGDETFSGRDIVVTQKDIREIQLAKAATRAGINTLLKKLGISIEDVEKVYIAGSFGFFLDPDSAITIGLLPNIKLDKISLVGNSAGMGAKLLLLSKTLRDCVNTIIPKIEYIELARQNEFSKEFMECLYLPSRFL